MSGHDGHNGVNPPHNIIRHELPAVIKARAFEYHKRAGTMETFYQMYPSDRPVSRDPRAEGRER